MDESTLWGTLGILLALVGLAVMLIDAAFLSALAEGNVGEPIVLYVVGVAAAALITLAVVGPNMASR